MQYDGDVKRYFKNEIERLSQMEIDELQKEIDEIREKAVKELEAEAEKEAAQRLDIQLKDMVSEQAVALSKLNEDKNRRLMVKRDEMTQCLFQDVIEKLKQFCKSKDYVPYLETKLKKIIDKDYGQMTLYVAEADKEVLSNLLSLCDASTIGKCDKQIKIGGFRIEFLDSGIMIDETFDSYLIEEQEWFYAQSGFVIQ